MNSSEDNKHQREQLEQAIAALESQRTALGDAVVDLAVAPLRQQLQGLAAAVRPDSQRLASERRIVSILFCDMVGSTTLAERVDPEDWTHIMNQVFRLLTEPIDHYGGTVTRLMGDAILALFGAPESHEDDPERAILAGLRILEKTRPFRREFMERTGMSFDFRVGINTGLTVVGEVGPQQMSEYTAMGDAVNVAARMEQTAAPGTVQISEATYHLAADLFDVKPLGAIAVKGRETPVNTYQVLNRKSRSRRGAEQPDRPLVGRQADLDRLRQLLDRAHGGEGQIVMLRGEAGIGKSRLIAELRAGWMAGHPEAPASAHWTEMSATSYSTGRPYGTFENQMRIIAGIGPTDSPASAREKLRSVLAAEPEQEFLQSIYERLLGIRAEDRDAISSEAFMQALYDSTLAAMRKNTLGGPSVIVFDDLQWVDPASLGLIEHILQLVKELPLLILLATRPESQGPVHELSLRLADTYRDRFTTITLDSLNGADSVRLADALIAREGLPESVRQDVLQRAEGNPFYIEELVQMLFEQDMSADPFGYSGSSESSHGDTGDLPANLMSLVISRMDRLPRDVRQTLQLAAVIGRSFYVRVLRQISDLQSALEAHLRQLETADMVREAAGFPEWEYVFRHALTQEAVYSSLLLEHRRQFHRRVGGAIEGLFPDRLREFAPILAHHFDEGRQSDKAGHYYLQAGNEAALLHANDQALTYYRRALAIATESGADVDSMIDLYRRLGRVLEHLNRYQDAELNYEKLEKLGLEKEEPSMVLAGHAGRMFLYVNPTPLFDPAKAVRLGGKALALADEIGDQTTTAQMNLQLSSLYTFMSRFEEAREYGERALAQARALGDRPLLAHVLNDLSSHVYSNTGDFQRSAMALTEARQLWRELGDKAMEIDSVATLAENKVFLGQFDEAIHLAEEGKTLSRSIRNRWGESHSQYMVGLAHWETGRPDRAIETMEESIRLSEAAGFMVPQVWTRCELAKIFALLGDTATALGLVDLVRTRSGELPNIMGLYLEVFTAQIHLTAGDLGAAERALAGLDGLATAAPVSVIEMPAHEAAAELALTQGDAQKALSVLGPLLDYLRPTGALLLQMPALLRRARALTALDRPLEALESLKEAHSLGTTIGSRWTMWQVEAQLGRLAGDTSEALAHFANARSLIESVHAHTPDHLRDSLLGRAAVQAVLGESQ